VTIVRDDGREQSFGIVGETKPIRRTERYRTLSAREGAARQDGGDVVRVGQGEAEIIAIK